MLETYKVITKKLGEPKTFLSVLESSLSWNELHVALIRELQEGFYIKSLTKVEKVNL